MAPEKVLILDLSNKLRITFTLTQDRRLYKIKQGQVSGYLSYKILVKQDI